MSDRNSRSIRPLLGDGHGKYRVRIVGNSGVGKSTLGLELGDILGVPCVSLDRLFWKPGWKESSPSEFRAKVRAALDQHPNGWVVDGKYDRLLGGLLEQETTDVIWLDPPLMLYFPRLCVRTFLRLFSVRPPCSPGCDETVRAVFFSSDSIIWWCLSHHWSTRRQEEAKLREDGVRSGGKRRRIGGSEELLQWKQSIRDIIMSERM